MWPWGHVAVGYLSYLGVERLRGRSATSGLPVLFALFGSLLPDLVDKPLAWTVSVLPTGRSFAHSLLTIAVVVGVLWLVLDHRQRTELLALAIGWVSHLFADGLHAASQGRYSELTYAVWPLLPLPTYTTEPSFRAHFQQLAFDGAMTFEVALITLAVVVWYRRR